MERLELYTKENCVQCTMTKKLMDSEGLEPTVFELDKDQEALDRVKELGHLAAPVVIHEDEQGSIEHWSGFRPDMIRKIIGSQAIKKSIIEA